VIALRRSAHAKEFLMKRFVTALCAVMVTSPAWADDALEARIERLEQLQAAQTVGYYAGASRSCEAEFPESIVDAKFPGLKAGDPELNAAFIQGIAAALAQEMFKLPSKALYCDRMAAYLKTLKD
jgi:hypothetical protein